MRGPGRCRRIACRDVTMVGLVSRSPAYHAALGIADRPGPPSGRHPNNRSVSPHVFLYESVWNIVVAVFLLWVDRPFTVPCGKLFALYVAAYTLGRGAIEALRVDHANHILATAQRLDLTDRVPGRRHRLVLATPPTDQPRRCPAHNPAAIRRPSACCQVASRGGRSREANEPAGLNCEMPEGFATRQIRADGDNFQRMRRRVGRGAKSVEKSDYSRTRHQVTEAVCECLVAYSRC